MAELGSTPPSVCVVVVTRNRLELLKHCIQTLGDQTHPPNWVVVVDNASDDGTAEWLETRANLEVITLANVGGAGGFQRGIERAMELGANWVWCQDDDGFADRGALAALVARCGTRPASVWNSLVVSTQDSSQLAFPHGAYFEDERAPLVLDRHTVEAAADDGVAPGAALFNGSLLSIEAVRAVGNVDDTMFIWGDEVDMGYRLTAHAPLYTVMDALHFHPPGDGGNPPLWKLYFALRNGIRNNCRYRSRPVLRNALLLRRIFPHMVRTGGLGAALRTAARATRYGVGGDFSADTLRP